MPPLSPTALKFHPVLIFYEFLESRSFNLHTGYINILSIAQTKADGYIKTNIQSESMPILESKDTTEQQSGNKQHLQMNNEVINPIKVLTIQEENKETLRFFCIF
jgi:hypothetical protein